MGKQAKVDRRSSGQAWLSTLVGILVLVVGGFLIGLVVGVVSEEPELVAGHVAGRSTEIDWTAPSPDGELGPQAGTWLGDDDLGAGGAVPAVASAPPPRPEAAGGAEFLVQVGAFADGVTARALAQRLSQGGYPVLVMEPTNDDRWRVRVGPLPARVEADQVALRLKSEEKLSTWVIRHTGS
jgi:cell division septation protein DedD